MLPRRITNGLNNSHVIMIPISWEIRSEKDRRGQLPRATSLSHLETTRLPQTSTEATYSGMIR